MRQRQSRLPGSAGSDPPGIFDGVAAAAMRQEGGVSGSQSDAEASVTTAVDDGSDRTRLVDGVWAEVQESGPSDSGVSDGESSASDEENEAAIAQGAGESEGDTEHPSLIELPTLGEYVGVGVCFASSGAPLYEAVVRLRSGAMQRVAVCRSPSGAAHAYDAAVMRYYGPEAPTNKALLGDAMPCR